MVTKTLKENFISYSSLYPISFTYGNNYDKKENNDCNSCVDYCKIQKVIILEHILKDVIKIQNQLKKILSNFWWFQRVHYVTFSYT